MNAKAIETQLLTLEKEFGTESVQAAIDAVKRFEIEVPTWAFGSFGGGRFGEYTPPGAARTIEEKLDDAAMVHKLTGATPRVAAHILWDMSEDGSTGSFDAATRLKDEAAKRGLGFGAVSPTYFLEGSYRGSLSSNEKATRDRYIEQTLLGAKIARELGNGLLTPWFPDGSAYPGQIQLRRAYDNMLGALKEIRAGTPDDVRILIEYKVFEPGTYSTTIPDWGTAAQMARRVGGNTGVLVDLGHHHHGTNIEQIVAMLIADDVPAGFHFNTRYAADDDHAVEPNAELARIFYELVIADVVSGANEDRNWAFMIDQCSSRENRMHATLHTVDSLQVALAKAMLVDTKELARLQKADEVILANRLFNDVLLLADVRPIVCKARLDKGLNPDPVQAYVDSGYGKKIESERT